MAPLYPAGTLGIGLLLLRLAVAGLALLGALLATGAPLWSAAAVVIAVNLSIGIAVRASASIGLVAAFCAPADTPLMLLFVHAVTAASLVLTGAGAYSADAKFFGRRRLVLPDVDDTPERSQHRP
jgi:uncharacterized membrane protein YphA (DoxX/SURF4 family)